MTNRVKFKIYVNGIQQKPPENSMFVMNSQGVFFLAKLETYYPSVTKLSNIYQGGYDVVWDKE